MSSSSPVFYDASGKRRKFVNIIAPIILLMVASFIVFVSIYVYRLQTINKSVEKVEVKPANPVGRAALFYTDNHTKAYAVASDRIEKIDTLLVPKYLVTNGSVTSTEEYKNWIKDLTFISADRPVHYNKFFVLSSKDYSLPPTDRESSNPAQAAVNKQLSSLISVDQMLSIREDLKKNGCKGLYIEVDFSVITDANTASSFSKWLGGFKVLLAEEELKLGLIVRPASINTSNKSLLSSADLLYVAFDSSKTHASQIAALNTHRSFFSSGNVTYEVPTVSRQTDTSIFGGYTSSSDYLSLQPLLMDKRISGRSFEPITIKQARSTANIVDAITTNNIIKKLQSDKLSTSETMYAIANPGFEEFTTWRLVENPFEDIRNTYLLSENLVAALSIKTVGSGQVYNLEDKGGAGYRKIEANAQHIITDTTVQRSSQPAVVLKSGKLPKKIALTFDDGPHPTRTPQVLDILERYNVKGTFFLVGDNIIAYPSVAKDIVARGHEVENHTFSHPVFSKLTQQSQIAQIKSNSDLIRQVTGQKVSFFRKPYSNDSAINTESGVQYLANLETLNLQASEYDIDSKDWLLDSPEEVEQRIKDELKNSNGEYSQILFHDTHQNIQNTLIALPKVIEYLKSQNIEIVRVDELTSGRTAVAGVSTTKTYRAIQGKDNFVTAFVWVNISFLLLSVLKYIWMVLGAIAYLFKHRLFNFFFKRLDRKHRRLPNLAVIIACYNEELVIARTLQSLLDCNYPNLRVIVVNDGSKDNSENVIKKFVKNDKRFKLITVPNGGKARALEIGIQHTQTKWLVFCDADTIFDSKALHNFANDIFASKNIGAVAGRIVVGNDNNALTRSQVIEYGVAHTFIKAAQDVGNTITVVPGAVGLWNRDVLISAGGFSPDTLAEDADATMRVIGLGKNVRYDSSAWAKTEAPESVKMLYKQRTRWQLGNMQAVFKHRRGLMNRQYGLLGFYGLPMFYLELISTLLYPMLLSFTALVFMANMYDWRDFIPSNLDFVVSTRFLIFSLVIIGFEILLSIFVIMVEKKSLKSKALLLATLPYYFLFYRFFLSYATIVSLVRALRGTFHGWGHLKRTATVK